MRGDDVQQTAMFSYISPEDRVPDDHPLRPIREMVNGALERLSPRFDELYSRTGRPSVPPEMLLRALLLQVLYTIRSERMLMEQLDFNLLFRWFVGLDMDEAVWHPTVFTKNRDRMLEGDVAQAFFEAVLEEARTRRLLSNEHFSVDGTLVDAWASHKSFRPKDEDPGAGGGGGRNPDVDFRGEKRSNATHRSTTDPDARLMRKGPGREAKLCYMGHVLLDNRHGLAAEAKLTKATGTAEREAALEMLEEAPRRKRATLGADKNYDTKAFVADTRKAGVTPHVTQNTSGNRSSAIDGRTTRHPGYEISLQKRKLTEQVFGWIKDVAALRKTRHRGEDRVGWMFKFAVAAYNLIRMRNLAEAAA